MNKDKISPKWLEDITILKTKCKSCDKLYIVEKMLKKALKIIHLDRTTSGSTEHFYYCNEDCLNIWTTKNPHRKFNEI